MNGGCKEGMNPFREVIPINRPPLLWYNKQYKIMEALQYNRYNRPIYYKSVTADNIELDDTGRIGSMYFAAFGNVDAYGDMIMKGAFTKSIQEHGPGSQSPQKIALLAFHNTREPVGRILNMTEDDYGLKVQFALDPIQQADRIMVQLKSGTINQGSIGFQYVQDKTTIDEKTNTWVLNEVQLYEVSFVTIGANENTPFLGFKDNELINAETANRLELEKALKVLPYSQQIELRQLISKSIALKEIEPGKPTHIVEPPQVNWFMINNLLKTTF
jgi:uncharacterized protein